MDRFDAPSQEDRAFCDSILPRVSRTFALSIEALPETLREAVGVAYLLCRVVDTIEDDPRIRGARAALFDAFDETLADDGSDASRLEALAMKAFGPTDAQRELVDGSGAVFRVFRQLSPAQRTAIRPCVAEMSRGMREYAARADGLPCGLRLVDLADLERYCYFVAGTVGDLLTSLFLPTVPEGAAWPPRLDGLERDAWLRARAKHFGLGLQLVNIVKDVASDFERGDCFLPEALAKEYGVRLDSLLEPAHREQGLALIRALCQVAQGHLDRAVEYTLCWPVEHDDRTGNRAIGGAPSASGVRPRSSESMQGGEAVRLFCAVPLALAYATLREVEQGQASLVPGRAPAVSSALVRSVFADVLAAVRDDDALASLFERCRLGTVGRAPRPMQPTHSAAQARSLPVESLTTNGHPIMAYTVVTPTRAPSLQPERSFTGKVLVTGAAGHVGANLLLRLLRDGRDVRVLLRPQDDNTVISEVVAATGVDVERVFGDLRDAGVMLRTLAGCETAFHVAAKVSTVGGSAEDLRDLFECNVVGTANLLRAAREVGTRRVVVTGSFSAVGYDPADPSKPADESMLVYPFDKHLPYGRTKLLVEHECLKAVAEGQDVVIATSCAVLGPWDYVPSRMGRTLLDFAHGKLRAYVPGGFEFVAASDIAQGHVLAMSRGRTGQKYIVSSEYMSVDQLMDIFEEVSGRPRPKLRLPAPVMGGVAEVSSFVLTNFFPNVPQRFTPGAVRILRMQRRADISKAKAELGYAPTTIRSAIHEAYADFARRGLVPQSPSLRSGVPAASVLNVTAQAQTTDKEMTA